MVARIHLVLRPFVKRPMHKDKVEELKQVLKTKKEAEAAQKASDETAAHSEEVNHLRKIQQELEQKIATLEENLKQTQAQAKESEDKFIRLCAEFDNFRKRTAREKEEQIRFSHEQVIKEILPVVDDLDRALSHASSSAEIPILIEGVQLVKKHLM